ncbi:TPA: hypothetical protein EYP38_04385 [Candidatus Micrarchaeota archaeon]|nr:hypothetical protein [Candidatus Micrarchaeota archaeon]
MKSEKKISTTWIHLMTIAAIFFFIIGTVMVTVDNLYVDGAQYPLTALLFAFSVTYINSGKVKIEFSSQNKSTFFTLGFIFAVIWLSINMGIWARE